MGKTRNLQKRLKLALVAIAMLSMGAVSAQKTDGTSATGGITKIEDVSKSKVLNGTIRVVDNKGTKKFLQVQNGLTLLTNEAPDGGIVSTWQLGGTLTDATEIKADNNEFKITLENGGTFIVDGIEETAEVAATSTTIGTSGYTVLVRNEDTGEVEKMLVSDLVEGGHMEVEASADDTVTAITDATIPAEYQKVSVYRNGAKLRANTDYTVAAGAVTLKPTVANDWAIYSGDVFEIQWVN